MISVPPKQKTYESLEEALRDLDIGGHLETVPAEAQAYSMKDGVADILFRNGKIEVVARITISVLELKLKDGYEEFRPVENRLHSSLEFSGEGVTPIDVTLQKTVGYLNGGAHYFQQLSSSSAAKWQIEPLLYALVQLYYHQEITSIPVTNPNHPDALSVSSDQKGPEELLRLRDIIGKYERFVPIAPKQG